MNDIKRQDLKQVFVETINSENLATCGVDCDYFSTRRTNSSKLDI